MEPQEPNQDQAIQSQDRNAIRLSELARRRMLQAKYAEMFTSVRSILTRWDPVGIIFDDQNPDEYDPEVASILPRLSDARSERDVQEIVYKVFIQWFSEAAAGPDMNYGEIAGDVWRLLQSPIGEHFRAAE